MRSFVSDAWGSGFECFEWRQAVLDSADARFVPRKDSTPGGGSAKQGQVYIVFSLLHRIDSWRLGLDLVFQVL